jgi:hypothetical protein
LLVAEPFGAGSKPQTFERLLEGLRLRGCLNDKHWPHLKESAIGAQSGHCLGAKGRPFSRAKRTSEPERPIRLNADSALTRPTQERALLQVQCALLHSVHKMQLRLDRADQRKETPIIRALFAHPPARAYSTPSGLRRETVLQATKPTAGSNPMLSASESM